MPSTKIRNSNIVDGTITSSKLAPSGITAGNYTNPSITVDTAGRVTSASNGVSGGPKITNIEITDNTYTVLDDTAVDIAGGYIKITGTGFVAGCQVLVNNVAAISTTFVSSTEVRAQVPATAAGTYVVYLVNSDGGVAIRVNGVTFSATPTWTTSSSLGGANNTAISIQLQATLAATYALAAGSTLPTGLTLTSGGLLSGTITGLTQETVYSFTIVATDSENQDSPRTFTLTITIRDYEVVTLHLPGNGTNGATNNTFRDSSTNNFTITRNGNTTQGTFSPFSQTGWGNYFDGTGDYLEIADNTAFNLSGGVWTIEAWINPNGNYSNYRSIINKRVNASASCAYLLGLNTSTGELTYYNGTLYNSTVTPTANVWNHVAAVYDGTNINLYLNGNRVLQSATGNTNVAANVRIGSYPSYSEDFFGYISNLRVVKGGALYSGTTYAVPTAPLTTTVSSGTVSLLTCQSNRFRDASTNNFTITANGSPSVQAFSPFKPTASWSAAAYGGSGYFDGTGDYLTVPDNSAWAFSGDFTIEAWVYPKVTNSENPIVAQWGGPGNANFIFQYTSGNRLRLVQTNTTITGSTTSIYINQWSHVAVTRSGSTIRLFVNGVLDGTTGTISGAFLNSTNPLTIGSLDGGGIPLTSYISDVRILNGTALYTTSFTLPTAPLTAISNTALLLNFTNAAIYDATSKNNLETVGNAQISTAQSKWGGSSMYFDGTGDYLQSPDSPLYDVGSGDWTIELWANFSSVSGEKGLVSHFEAGTPNKGYTLRLSTSNSPSGLRLVVGTTADVILQSAWSPSTSVWYHIAAVRSGNTLSCYVNGTLIGSTSITGAIGNPNVLFVIGSTQTVASSDMSGYMQDLRITRGYARYTANFTAPTAAFPTL